MFEFRHLGLSFVVILIEWVTLSVQIMSSKFRSLRKTLVCQLKFKPLHHGYCVRFYYMNNPSCMRPSHSETTSKQEVHNLKVSIIGLFNPRYVSRWDLCFINIIPYCMVERWNVETFGLCWTPWKKNCYLYVTWLKL